MKKMTVLVLALFITVGAALAGELTLSTPLVAQALDNPTCLHVEPDAESEYVVCVQEGADITLVARMADKTEVDGVENYWWKVELPDGSNAWVFGAQIAVEVKKTKEK
jgi:hypothetical protein